MTTRDKQLRLTTAVTSLEKQFGRGIVLPMEGKALSDVPVIPTGSLGLDAALGVGGLARGRIIEMYGPESAGTATLALSVVAQAQHAGDICAYIDAVHALDPNYARRLGVNPSELLISQPDCGEQGLEVAETLVRSGAVDLVVFDSMAALTPRSELEGEMGEAHAALQARLMSQALRKLTAVADKQGCTVIFLNQGRMKIGVVFGSPDTTPGGNALKFYASVRLDVRDEGTVQAGEQCIGSRVRVKVVKNKLASPFREAAFELLSHCGINRVGELLDLGEAHGLIQTAGTAYLIDGQRLTIGRYAPADGAADDERQRVLDELARRLRAKLLLPPKGEVQP